MPVDIGKLETPLDSAHPSRAILFQPWAPVPFEQAWNAQRDWRTRLLEDPQAPEAVWCLEHPACFTLGRGASSDHLRFDPTSPPLPLHRIDRGGEVTHHLPGQLVVYPVLDLSRRNPDLHWYLRQLEQVMIEVLAKLGLQAERLPGLTGLWLENRKVGAIGVGCRRWITQHGLSLNVDCDLSGFSLITPCGLEGLTVGRLTEWIPGLTVGQVQPLLVEALARRFDLVWITQA